MGTTADKLNKLLATKAGIKAALVEKGQPVSDSDTFASYEGKIRAIRTSDIQLASIVVTKQPTKTSYTAKETFNRAGMEVKAVFSNDAYKFVTDFTTEPSGALKPTDTKVKVKYTEFGVTAEADVAITVAAIKLSVPTQSGAPVYTGSAITPAWSGYDSSLMTISGETSGTNAGSYTAVFSLKDKVNYTWADGTTADKSVAWSIGKAQASITLDKTSVVLNGDKLTETVNISSVGMTSIMAMSSDMTVATVSLNGNVMTISSVDETTGTATIVINGEVDSNYNAPEYPSIAVSAEFVVYANVMLVMQFLDSDADTIVATATINGTTYSKAYADADGDGDSYIDTIPLVLPIGSEIELVSKRTGSYGENYINLNNNVIDDYKATINYTYTVTGDVTIALNYWYGEIGPSMYGSCGRIDITEIPEGLITFTIKESSNAYGTKTYQAEVGMTWGEWVDSEYNKDDYYTWYIVKDNMIYHTEESLYVCVPSSYTFPSPTGLILPNFAYVLEKD